MPKTNPFAHLDPRTRGLVQVVEAQLALDAQPNQPVEIPRPPAQPLPQPTPKKGDLEQQFAHLADAVRDLNNSHAGMASQIVISAAKARGDIPTVKPITAIAQAFMDAADKARTPVAEPDLPTDPTARAIVLAARKAVNPHHPVRR